MHVHTYRVTRTWLVEADSHQAALAAARNPALATSVSSSRVDGTLEAGVRPTKVNIAAEFGRRYYAEHGHWPTSRELARVVGNISHQTANEALKLLAAGGELASRAPRSDAALEQTDAGAERAEGGE